MIKRTTKNLLVVFVIFIISFNTVFSQQENSQEEGLNKNAIYGNVGIGGMYFTATAYYEHILPTKGDHSSFIKIGCGGYVSWGDEGIYVPVQFGMLTGTGKHHLEIGAGPNIYLYNSNPGVPPITATFGWRVQKPGGHFIFRAGLSWPEALYFGLGFSF